MSFLPVGHDRGGVTIVGAVQVAAANDERRAMSFQNTSDTEMRLTENGVAASSTTGYKIAAGQAVSIGTQNAISVYCASAGKTFASTEL